MPSELFYDCEIINLVSPEPGYTHCNGFRDFEHMGISVIGCYHSQFGLTAFVDGQFDIFANWVKRSSRIIGFNSLSFDDLLCQANNIEIKTDYDLLKEIRLASGQPANYVYGQTRAGYSLEAIAQANLGKGKIGNGSLAPKLWQDGKTEEVISYCLNDVQLLFELYQRRDNLIDPTNGKLLCCRP